MFSLIICAFSTTYKLNNDVLEITGNSGDVLSLEEFQKEIVDKTLYKHIRIKGGFSEIPDEMFNESISLIDVAIDSPIVTFGISCFKDCKLLKSVTVPKTLSIVKSYAFANCEVLISIKNPNEDSSEPVEGYLGDHAFEGCMELTSIDIPQKIVRIEERCFNGCPKLDGFVFPKTCKILGPFCFTGCNTFIELNLEGIETINESCFSGCSNLEKVNFGSNPTVKYLGANAFANDKKLKIVSNLHKDCVVDQYAFSYCDVLENIDFPANAISIKKGTFNQCFNLASFVFPQKLQFIGKDAFKNCSLKSITFPSSVTYLGNSSFSNNKKLSTVVLSDGIQQIGSKAFLYCSELYTLKLSPNIVNVSASAFERCKKLREVIFSDNLRNLGVQSFAYCAKLAKVELGSKCSFIGEKCFHCCYELTEFTFPEPCHAVAYSMFGYCQKLTNVTLSPATQYIFAYAFGNMKSIVEIKLPSTIKSISTGAFSNCISLKSIVIPSKVSTLSKKIFDGCSSLESVEIMGNITSINSGAFNCSKLHDLTFYGNIKNCDDHAFVKIKSDASITYCGTTTVVGNALSSFTDVQIHVTNAYPFTEFAGSRSLSNDGEGCPNQNTPFGPSGNTILGMSILNFGLMCIGIFVLLLIIIIVPVIVILQMKHKKAKETLTESLLTQTL